MYLARERGKRLDRTRGARRLADQHLIRASGALRAHAGAGRARVGAGGAGNADDRAAEADIRCQMERIGVRK